MVGGIIDLRTLKCTSRIDVLNATGGTWERRADLPTPRHSVRITKTGEAQPALALQPISLFWGNVSG